MNSNIERLGNTLSQRMKATSRAAVPTTIELGTVNANMSISTDGLMGTIPKGDYMVNILLAGGSPVYGGAHDGHSEGNGEHVHSIRSLQPGDRILVAWSGSEPVVIAIVVSS